MSFYHLVRKYKYFDILSIVFLVFCWRLLISVTVDNSALFLNPKASFVSASEIFALPLADHVRQLAVFDGVHYINVAIYGYALGLTQAFFPVFPLLLRVVSNMFTVHLIVAGLAISFLSTIFGSIFWFKYFQEIKLKKPGLVILLWLLFPTSFYLAAVYTEGLFFLLSGLVMLLIQKQRYLLAAICIGLASGTRLVGFLLLIPLLIEFWMRHDLTSLIKQKQYITLVKKYFSVSVALIMISLSGLLIYCLYLWRVFDNPFMFFQVQSEFGAGRSLNLISYPQVVWRAIKIMLTQRPIDWRYFTSGLELLSGTVPLMFISVVIKNKKLLGLTIFSLASFILPTLTGTFSSMPRYILICPVIFYGLYIWLENKKYWLYLWLTISTMLLLICTTLFSRGYWIG